MSEGEGNGNPLQYSCLENPIGCRSLVGCSPWGREESDTTERLHFHFSLSCIGEGNGNPLQCSCLENPRGGGAWWAAVYGVAQSRTRLKWLSSIPAAAATEICVISLGKLKRSRIAVNSYILPNYIQNGPPVLVIHYERFQGSQRLAIVPLYVGAITLGDPAITSL